MQFSFTHRHHCMKYGLVSSFLTRPDERKTKECLVLAPTDPAARVHLHRKQQPETPEKDISRMSAGRLSIMDPSFSFPLSFS